MRFHNVSVIFSSFPFKKKNNLMRVHLMVAISEGGLRDGGVAHLTILMNNCPRISFLDKASFILTPIVAE